MVFAVNVQGSFFTMVSIYQLSALVSLLVWWSLVLSIVPRPRFVPQESGKNFYCMVGAIGTMAGSNHHSDACLLPTALQPTGASPQLSPCCTTAGHPIIPLLG